MRVRCAMCLLLWSKRKGDYVQGRIYYGRYADMEIDIRGRLSGSAVWALVELRNCTADMYGVPIADTKFVSLPRVKRIFAKELRNYRPVQSRLTL